MSVEERLPDECDDVLAFLPNAVQYKMGQSVFEATWIKEAGWHFHVGEFPDELSDEITRVTYWHPFPEPPE